MTLVVNGEKIEDSVIQQEAERLRPSYEKTFKDMAPKKREEQLLDWSKENVIERVLIDQEAKKDGDRIPQDQLDAALAELKKRYEGRQLPEEFNAENEEKIKEEIELQMKVERMLQNVCKDVPGPSQEAVLKFYEENKEQLKSAERARVAHIVKYVNWQTDEEAAYNAIRKVQDELKNGAAFETIVDKYTDCADSGGDLGYVMRGQMVEEFEDVVFNLNVGEISDVFRTRFGFHIARLYDRKPPVVPGLKEVRDHIVSELAEQMRAKAIEEFVDKLKIRAKIEEI
jgi:parvulin-like peptidyl-prolyl isomerase